MVGGVRLPPDRFCLTGVAWDLREEWESEREDEMEVDSGGQQNAEGGGGGGEEDEDVDGTMEDVFGEDRQNGQDEDQEMGGA
jgi:transcription initiation factor TFIID subunit 9B